MLRIQIYFDECDFALPDAGKAGGVDKRAVLQALESELEGVMLDAGLDHLQSRAAQVAEELARKMNGSDPE